MGVLYGGGSAGREARHSRPFPTALHPKQRALPFPDLGSGGFSLPRLWVFPLLLCELFLQFLVPSIVYMS